MLKDEDNFYLKQPEDIRACLFALKDVILAQDSNLQPAWKYRMPFFCYKEKMFCYLWVDRKSNQPYIGLVEGQKIDHPALVQEKRSQIKILRIDPSKDLPLKTIRQILSAALQLYKS